MHLDFSLPPLAFFDLQPWMIGVILPVILIVGAAAIAISAMYFHHRKNEQWHQTARVALEKGQPLPTMQNSPPPQQDPRSETSNDLRGGLVLIGVGLGLWVFLQQFLGGGLYAVGAIPAFIGAALLISGIVRYLATRKDSSKTGRPPQP